MRTIRRVDRALPIGLVLLLVSIVIAACGSSGGAAATAGAARAPADNLGGLQGVGSAQEGESGQQAPQPAASAGPGQPEVGAVDDAKIIRTGTIDLEGERRPGRHRRGPRRDPQDGRLRRGLADLERRRQAVRPGHLPHPGRSLGGRARRASGPQRRHHEIVSEQTRIRRRHQPEQYVRTPWQEQGATYCFGLLEQLDASLEHAARVRGPRKQGVKLLPLRCIEAHEELVLDLACGRLAAARRARPSFETSTMCRRRSSDRAGDDQAFRLEVVEQADQLARVDLDRFDQRLLARRVGATWNKTPTWRGVSPDGLSASVNQRSAARPIFTSSIPASAGSGAPACGLFSTGSVVAMPKP